MIGPGTGRVPIGAMLAEPPKAVLSGASVHDGTHARLRAAAARYLAQRRNRGPLSPGRSFPVSYYGLRIN
ncbi:hypothetical protein GCM10010151_35930 [Actinoallomurus spadix]|uniref:Uncharacterized protein n=1 Tax=Actinoallomurus spadix TaxID=79912 RepID=A0ABN0WPH9_9ACTN